jgi:hypothetical protein
VQTFRATKKPALVKLGIANRPRSRTPRGAPDLSELSLVNRANSAGLTLFNICRIRKRFVPPAKSEFQPLRRLMSRRHRGADRSLGPRGDARRTTRGEKVGEPSRVQVNQDGTQMSTSGRCGRFWS